MTQQTPTLGLSFFVKKYKVKEGTTPLYLRISVNETVSKDAEAYQNNNDTNLHGSR